MSDQFNKNLAGCIIFPLGICLMLAGIELFFEQDVVFSCISLLLGFLVAFGPYLWSRNISYDRDGNEVLSKSGWEEIKSCFKKTRSK